ncbi:thioredoxin fold domain-containing protein [Rhodoferax sp. UBA5149]|uniref:thioredoxin fold domain-containing protein n=1 Tax=Rhodoferax sp. UBA5149 TaxID=1947379 RepID=UPI0025E4C1A1|nr:thioredoxin fold domain-containing protein [Rhodoferax sp. UBA5149]
MKLANFALPFFAALLLGVVGCSPQDAADKAAMAKPALPYEAAAAQGKGFTVGAMMSANPVYVLFDPQCPHCGHLWEASLPLHNKVKFVWLPVAFISPKSAPQGAALLSAANPAELMAEHEKSILAGTGGIAASSSVPADLELAIKKNTQLFNSLGGESVPYILAKNQRTGQVVTNTGALDTPALAAFLGLDQP